jgi:hypothetical protein
LPSEKIVDYSIRYPKYVTTQHPNRFKVLA